MLTKKVLEPDSEMVKINVELAFRAGEIKLSLNLSWRRDGVVGVYRGVQRASCTLAWASFDDRFLRVLHSSEAGIILKREF